MSGAVTLGCTKKRKKTDTKPQAQKNKCYNEKRRREQENLYIEDLADLISTSFASMNTLSAVKPDKCAILQETVNQIRLIKEQERSRLTTSTTHLEQSTSSLSPGGGSGSSANAVQQGEVSSSRPIDILHCSDLAPYLLEALEGFLIIVSKEGRIEQCSKNIEKYIKFTQDEVLHKDFFNIIHLGDTARFNAILKPPMSVGWSTGGEENEISAAPNNRSFTCRFLVKPPDDREATLDERQQRIEKYEQMHVCSTEVQYPPKDENAETCLMCIARRIPHTEKAKVVSCDGSAALEQFSTKLDIEGKIVSIDTTAVSGAYAPYINKDLVGKVIQELCPASEVPRINAHLKEVIQSGNPITATFRLRFASALDKYINIQSTSKFFKSELVEHIMSTHFIIGIGELDEIESGSILESGNTTPNTSGNIALGGNTPIGDPVMASVMNGATPSTAPSNTNPTSSAPPSYNLFSNTDHEFDFPFPTSTWGDMMGDDITAGWGTSDSTTGATSTITTSSRPDSRPHSATTTPVSTPRPLSASPCVPSPLHPQFQSQQSPANHHNNFSSSQPQYGSTMDDVSFKLEEPIKESSLPDDSLNGSGRLRNLLTKKPECQPSPSPSVNNNNNSEDDARNKHKILKILLNKDDDDDESKHDIKLNIQTLSAGLGMPSSSHSSQEQSKSGNNHMLLKLLNEKSDDDDVESRAGFKKQSELLQELLKGSDEDRKPPTHTDSPSQTDLLLQNLGFTNSPASPSRKRPYEDPDDHISKRLSDGTQVTSTASSTGSSKLSQKNKMLASLLAKQPTISAPIPTLPARVISATPQEISRVASGEIRKRAGDLGYYYNDVYKSSAATTSTTTATARGRGGGNVNRTSAATATQSNSAYLNQILSNQVPTSIRNSLDQTYNSMGVNQAGLGGLFGNNRLHGSGEMIWGDTQDKMLSDILDQVIDIVPEVYVTGNPTLMNMISEIEAPQQRDVNETMAINAITQSLMQCENAVRSPSSPVMSVPPGTPPAYSSATTSIVMTSTNQSGFPPPPGYHQRNQRFPIRNPQYSNLTQQQLILQRTKQQQEQKRRLLQQQQQQQLLIPSNAQAELNAAGIQNIDNLVAPNVSLQRSSSVPDSQLSPGYNMSPGGQRIQQPYSPSYSQANQFSTGGSQLSPIRPGGTFTNTVSSPVQPASWGSPTQQSRLGLPQQQNPMLNAQLTGTNYQNRSFAAQRNQMNSGQRNVNMVSSPGPAGSNARQSPFSTSDVQYQTAGGNGGGNSPTATAAPSYSNYQQQLHRLQRSVSATPPSATTHLPGGLGSPRHYLQNPHQMPHQSHPHNMVHYASHPVQQGYEPAQYCYDQSSLQLAYNGADRGRAPPLQGGGPGGNNMTSTSEFVRQELRAVVGARTGNQNSGNGSQNNRVQNTMQLPGGQQVSSAELEALGLAFEMAPTQTDYYGRGNQTR